MTSPASPMLFSTDGYRLVVMPMVTEKAREYEKAKQEAKPTEATEPVEPEAAETAASEAAEVVAEAEAIAKGAKSRHKSGKRSKAKEPIAVA